MVYEAQPGVTGQGRWGVGGEDERSAKLEFVCLTDCHSWRPATPYFAAGHIRTSADTFSFLWLFSLL